MFWVKWWSNVLSSLIPALDIRFITWAIHPSMLSLLVNPGMMHRCSRHIAIVPFVEALSLVIQKTMDKRLKPSNTLNRCCSRFYPLCSPSISTAATTRSQSFQLSSIQWAVTPITERWFGEVQQSKVIFTLVFRLLKDIFSCLHHANSDVSNCICPQNYSVHVPW